MRTTLPSLDGFEPEIGRADRLFDRAELRRIERLRDDQRRLGHRQAGELIERHLRAVGFDVHAVENRDRCPSGADAGELVPDVFERAASIRLFDFAEQSLSGRWTSMMFVSRID